MEGEIVPIEEKREKIMITKIIGEMKNNFNKSEGAAMIADVNSISAYENEAEVAQEQQNGSEIQEEIIDGKKIDFIQAPKVSENLEKEQIKDLEIEEEAPKVDESTSKLTTNVKKVYQKSSNKTSVATTVLKRSARRQKTRDCESVLQSAIARKEKSYNESQNQPQRLTRQLKLTPKILENLGQFPSKERVKGKVLKTVEKRKNINGSESAKTLSKHKSSSLDRYSKRMKKLKPNYYEKASDSENADDNSNDYDFQSKEVRRCEEKSFRRSQRISASRSKDDEAEFSIETDTPEASIADQESNIPADPECSSVGADLIASKMCFCTKRSNMYLPANSKEVFCQAIDSIGGKLLGCNNLVDVTETPITRPSYRVPYGVLCEVHSNRMLRHNRCPTCGVFCTQGKFVECENKHHYHRNCQISIGNIECCPHCSVSTPSSDVFITMYSSRRPVFLTKQRTYSPSAKMGFPNRFTPVTRNGRESPLLPPDVTEYEIVPNGYDKNVDIEAIVEVIKMENYEKLAQILGSKNFQQSTLYEPCENDTIIHFCAKNGYLSALHMFCSINVELEILDKDQNTPLMVAIVAFKNDVVKYLIKSGSSITFKGMDGMTALHLSAQYGNLIACELLLQAASNKREYINTCDDGGWTALVWACEYSYSEIALYFLRKAADPMVQDLKQNIALHWAACSGSQNCIEYLLNFGSEINSVNVQGDTALHIAARENKYNAVVLLLLRGSDTSITNKLGETPIDCVMENSDCYKAIILNMNLQAICSREERLRILLCNDISNGREMNPIQCINMVDNEGKPTDFVYMTDYCFTSDVSVDTKVTSLHHCACEDDCNTECICAQNSLNSYDEDGKLTDFNFYDPPLIFECNNLCPCNALTCVNRVVQRGLRCRFQLYKTDSKGWGVKSLTLVPKGRFVCEYIGEIISDLEADHRSDDYLFDLDDRETETYCIDARKYGNIARFFNHSCEANLTPVKVFINHQDTSFPRIALFANRDIQPEEELCFDYGIKYWIIKSKSFTCECRNTTCRYSAITIQDTLENYQLQLSELQPKDNV